MQQKVLKFTLSGVTAFFKKPEVNTYMYFTYGNIHKIALLGLLGAIQGYGGYNQRKNQEINPQFYTKLKDIKVGISPLAERGVYTKKVQTTTNTTGFYNIDSNKNPCTHIIKEQWLENPSWTIYILLDNKETEAIANSIINNRSKYPIYLGKNEHFADITNVEIVEGVSVQIGKEENIVINSLCFKEDIKETVVKEQFTSFKYEEKLPIKLDEKGYYILDTFVYTNNLFQLKDQSILRGTYMQIQGKCICFI